MGGWRRWEGGGGEREVGSRGEREDGGGERKGGREGRRKVS